MSEIDILCPYPLLSSYSDIDTTILVPGSNCVVPCPSIVYTDSEWYVFQNTIAILIYISFFASSLTLISHIAFQKGPNLYIRKMFIAGFVGNSFVISLFMLANRDNNIVCNGSTHYVKHKGLCVAQAFCTIFFLLWTEVWAAILALDTFLHISSWVKLTDINSLHRKYTIAAIIISTVPCIIPLAIGNLGFDPYANIPICLFLSLDNGNTTSKFFWGVFFWPFYLFLLVTIIFTVYGAIKLHKIFVTSNAYFRNKNNNISSNNLEAQRSGEGTIGLRMNNNPIHDNAAPISRSGSQASSLNRGGGSSIGAGVGEGGGGGMGKSSLSSGIMNNNKTTTNTTTNNNTTNNNSSNNNNNNNINNNNSITTNTKTYKYNNNDNNNNNEDKSGNTVTNSDRKRDDAYDIYNGRTDVSKSTFIDAFNLNSAATSTVSNTNAYSTSDRNSQTLNQKKKNVPRDYSVNFQSQSNSQMDGDLAIALYSGATPYVNSDGGSREEVGDDGDKRFITDVYFNDDYDNSRNNNNNGRGSMNAPDVLSRSVNRSLNSELHLKDASSSSHSVSMASYSYSNSNRADEDDNDRNDQDEYESGRGSDFTTGSELDTNHHRYGSESDAGAYNTGTSPFSSVDKSRTTSSQDSRFKSTFRATFANSDVRTALANIWKYNGRSIQFVAVFCLTTLCVAPCTLHVYYFEYGKYIDSTNEYVECLMTSAVTAQTINANITQSEVNQQAKDACGVQPSRIPPIWEVLVIMVWVSAYGIVPAIIFGGFMDPLKWLYDQFLRIIREMCGLGIASSSSSSSSLNSSKTSAEERDVDRHYVITDDNGNVVITSAARERSLSSTNSGS